MKIICLKFFCSQTLILDLSENNTSKNGKRSSILGPKEKEISLRQLKIFFTQNRYALEYCNGKIIRKNLTLEGIKNVSKCKYFQLCQ